MKLIRPTYKGEHVLNWRSAVRYSRSVTAVAAQLRTFETMLVDRDRLGRPLAASTWIAPSARRDEWRRRASAPHVRLHDLKELVDDLSEAFTTRPEDSMFEEMLREARDEARSQLQSDGGGFQTHGVGGRPHGHSSTRRGRLRSRG